MIYKINDLIILDFTTHNSATGMVSDADFVPACEVFAGSNDSPILSPTVEKRTNKTGNYKVLIEATVGNGFEVGKSYNVIVFATVNNISAKSRIASLILDSKRNADLNDLSQLEIEEKLEPIKLETDKIQSEIIEKKNEFKADVSALALDSTVAKETQATLNKEAIINELDDNEEKIDLIKIETDKIQSEIIEKKNEFKADVSDLALETTSQSIKETVEGLDLELDGVAKESTLETKASQESVDAIKIEVDKIELIKQMETGKWKIISNQMIFYKDDNTTEIARFNLFDKDGIATMTDAVERQKV